MSRTQHLAFGAVLCAAIFLVAADLAAAEPPRRPNVLFIAIDDLRPDLGCYGNAEVKSPNIDALARRGVVFQRAYCQQAVCSPSRTSLLTGLRPDSTKVYDLETHFRDTIPDVVTLPQHFKNQGYYTVGMGKIYHGGLDDAASWSEPHKTGPGAGYVRTENKQIIAEKQAQGRAEGQKGKALSAVARGPAFEAANVPDSEYQDGSVADLAVAKLADLKAKNQPFFLAVGFLKPHLPFNAPQKYWDLYDPAALKLAENNFRQKDAPPYAITDFGELRRYHGIPATGPIPEPLARQLVHGYRAATSFTDANIGRILDQLDSLGLAESTIVVLWGDHGWKLGEHAGWCKHTNVENDTRVVLIVAAPGAKANGRSSAALVEFVDIYPTLCELAGLPLPGHLQGTGMQPLLADPARPWKTAAFSQYPRSHEGKSLMGYAMRTDRYRLVQWRDRSTGAAISHELYDHQTDPAENQNLAGRPENKELLLSLATRLQEGWQGARPK